MDLSDGEIKAFPVIITKNGPVPAETIAITMVEANLPEKFSDSRLFKKIQKILFVPYFIKSFSEFLLLPIAIFNLNEDIEIRKQLENDYLLIREKTIKNEISGEFGTLVQSRTKGTGHGSTTRAFYFKREFINKIISKNFSEISRLLATFVMNTGPIIKWAGGKSDLYSTLKKYFQTQFETYVEPFLGGGAVVFNLIADGILTRDHTIILNDINPHLINFYNTVKTDSEFLISEIVKLQNEFIESDKQTKKVEFYNSRRAEFNNPLTEIKRKAVLFLYLNINCFNGLYRVNANKEFNVPIGASASGTIAEISENKKAGIKQLSLIFNSYKILLLNIDYIDIFKKLFEDTSKIIVYCDPPYIPTTETSFVQYFGAFDNDVFLHQCQALGRKHQVIISNSYTTKFRYGLPGFQFEIIECQRLIGAKTRTKAKEYIAHNEKLITAEIEQKAILENQEEQKKIPIEEAKQESPKVTHQNDFSKMTCEELRKYIKSKNGSSYSGKKKEELIKMANVLYLQNLLSNVQIKISDIATISTGTIIYKESKTELRSEYLPDFGAMIYPEMIINESIIGKTEREKYIQTNKSPLLLPCLLLTKTTPRQSVIIGQSSIKIFADSEIDVITPKDGKQETLLKIVHALPNFINLNEIFVV